MIGGSRKREPVPTPYYRAVILRARILLTCVCSLLAIAACSGSGDADVADAVSSCTASAQQVVARFDEFLEPFNDLTPDQFLADPQLDGLDAFQSDIANLIVGVATNPNDDCTESDLEREVDLALQQYAGEGLLNQYLVGTIRQGTNVERRDVAVTPDDDLLVLLPLLGPGSSITFSAGTFSLDATVLVQSDLLLVGAGRDETIIESTAESAALAVLGAGNLVMNDLSVHHVGEASASVVLVIDAALEMVRVGIAGGAVDADGAGGSGLVLTESEQRANTAVTIDDSLITDNAAAGIAITGTFAPDVLNTTIEANAQCGICLFDEATGHIQANTLTGNGVGLQASGAAAPEISQNSFVDNLVAGVLIEGESTAVLVDNTFAGIDIVGVDVQDSAAPVVQRNTFGAHAVAISLRGSSTAAVSENLITGGDIGILVGGTATPDVFSNELLEAEIAGMLHGEESAGEFKANKVVAGEGAGVVVEASARPMHTELTIEGGLVGAVFRQDAVGSLTKSTFTGQQVGLEISESAGAMIDSNTFVGSTDAGAILSGTGTIVLRGNTFDEPIQIGMQTGGQAEPVIEDNTIQGGDTGLLITDESRPTVSGNMFTGQSFGIGVSGAAAPIIEGNTLQGSSAGAISFEGESGGEVRANTVLDAGVVGIRVAGSADPAIEDNTLFAAVAIEPRAPTDDAGAEDPDADDAAVDDSEAGADSAGEDDASTGDDAAAGDEERLASSGAGLLYAESATGVAANNEFFGFVISIQVSDAASPTLTSNRVDGAGVGGVGILYGLEASGTAEANLSINQQLGFQLSGTASPSLVDNTVENVSVAAFLLQGESVAQLDGNECDGAQVGIVVLEQAAPELGDNGCPLAQ